MIEKNELKEIAESYGWNVEQCLLQRIKSGHIHDSYRLILDVKSENQETHDNEKETKSFFLQRINTSIFGDPQKLMTNIHRVSTLINSLDDPHFISLSIIPLRDGTNYANTSNGKSYRVYRFLEHYKSVSENLDLSTIKQVGENYGRFIAVLKNENPETYHVTLNDFHNINRRLSDLENAQRQASKYRREETESLLKIVSLLRIECRKIQQLIDHDTIPIRICHNDTKASNIMYNSTLQSYCVVDLDTVMPSSLLFDFGDAIRSIISDCAEDEILYQKNKLRWDLVSAFTKGFAESTVNFICDSERQHLVSSCVLLPYMMGVRFLTDYLNNDVYFTTEKPKHNLIRARNQLELAQQIHQERDKLKELIEQCFTDKNYQY